MANLKFNEKQLFEKLFDKGGYVLDFNNRDFQEFFNDFKIDIFSEKYNIKSSGSKMNRLRAFWELENDMTVGKVLKSLLELANQIGSIEEKDFNLAKSYIDKLSGINDSVIKTSNEITESEFLKQEFSNINLASLELDFQLEETIKQRLKEIELSLNSGVE